MIHNIGTTPLLIILSFNDPLFKPCFVFNFELTDNFIDYKQKFKEVQFTLWNNECLP